MSKFSNEYSYDAYGNLAKISTYLNKALFSTEVHSGDSLCTITSYFRGEAVLKYVSTNINGLLKNMRYEKDSLTEITIVHRNNNLEIDTMYNGHHKMTKIYSCITNDDGDKVKEVDKDIASGVVKNTGFVYSDIDKQGNYGKMEKYEDGRLTEKIERRISYW